MKGVFIARNIIMSVKHNISYQSDILSESCRMNTRLYLKMFIKQP